jgi:hypothetical protein
VKEDRSRDYFLSKPDTYKIIDACPNAQGRLIFALRRFGGLRCPSGKLGVKRIDVDWGHKWFIVHSPKTERHGDEHASRRVSIFPELRPLERMTKLRRVLCSNPLRHGARRCNRITETREMP